MRSQVVIIGGGPSGLLTSQILHRAGIDTVVLEQRSRDYVLARIRAGLLEWGTVELLRSAGVGARMDREGFVHDGTFLSARNAQFRIDYKALTGRSVMVFGQTEVTRELYAARDAMDGVVINEADGVTPHDLDGASPYVTYVKDGQERRIDCDWVIGCDGFRGVSRMTIPETIRREYELVYPFGWLGILSETPPVSDELIYANHERGFALCTMRHAMLSRYYVQCPADDPIEKWPDDVFWDELKRRIPEDAADRLVTGPSIEKSIAPLRSFVAEPMRWGRLMLCGDAAHIVPPTGAKGLNLAASDVYYLTKALCAYYADGTMEGVDGYSERALARIWKAERFSWWMTRTLHRFPGQSVFEQRMQEAELDYLAASTAAQTTMAENYVGLPY